MITVYDRSHNLVGVTFSYSNLCLEEQVDTGDKTLSFTYVLTKNKTSYSVGRQMKFIQKSWKQYPKRAPVLCSRSYTNPVVLEPFPIEMEYYIAYGGQEYVVKQVQGDKITAVLNLEWLRAPLYKDFEIEYQSYYISEGVYAWKIKTPNPVAGPVVDFYSGFVNCDNEPIPKPGTNQSEQTWSQKRPLSVAEGNGLDIVNAICTAYLYEPVFDTIDKKVYFYSRVGADNGVEFRKGLNLKTVNKKTDSFDFYTTIYPTGKDGLEVTNPDASGYYPEDGRTDTSTLIRNNVVTDFSFCRKSRVFHWKDENCTDAAQLLADAKLLIKDMSHPLVTYDVKVRDLASISDDFSSFRFSLGDVITIIDPDTDAYEKQRIIAMKTYPQNRDQDTMTIANTMLTFQQIQSKLSAAAKLVSQVTSNGKILLSSIQDIIPVSGQVVPASSFIYTVNSLTRQLSNVSFSVTVSGNFTAGQTVTVGTLPTGFRPSQIFSAYASNGGTTSKMEIGTDGTVRVTQYGSTASPVSFNGSFMTSDPMPTPSGDLGELRAIEEVLDLDGTGMTKSQRVQQVNSTLGMTDTSGTEEQQIARAYKALAVSLAAATGSSVLDSYDERISDLETAQEQTEEKLAELDDIKTTMTPYDYVEGSIYNAATQETYGDDPAYAHAFYHVVPGKTYFITGSSASNGGVYPACAFFQEGHTFRLARFGDDSSTAYSELEVVAPAGSDYMVINKTALVSAVKSTQEQTISEALDDVKATVDTVGEMGSKLTIIERKVNNGFAPASSDAAILASLRNPFKYKPFDKGYVSFVFDDLRSQQDSIASIFELYDMPLCLAAIPSRMGVIANGLTQARGSFTPGMYMYEVVEKVVQNGGETMAHNSVVINRENQYDYDVMWNYFVYTKQRLENWLSRTGPIRGIIRAGGSNQISSSREIERWLYANYEYSDLGNHPEMECYHLNRVNINQPLATIKSLIDDCERNKTWLRFYGHDYDYGGGTTLTGEQDLMDILDYVASKNVGVATFAHMYDTFRSTQAEENVRNLLNNG